MTNTRQRLTLPNEQYRLEEINIPRRLAAKLAGKEVVVEVAPEEEGRARKPHELGLAGRVRRLSEPQRTILNFFWPSRISFTDLSGRIWRLPRYWLTQEGPPSNEEVPYEVTQEHLWAETLHLPNWWDLCDINIAPEAAWKVFCCPISVGLRAKPGQQVEVYWWDSDGKGWRLPHDWRRRRIKLPASDRLVENGVPPDIAEEFAGKVVSVNYHPGSLCCEVDAYRFRDGYGGKWTVKAADCALMGYGDEEEKLA